MKVVLPEPLASSHLKETSVSSMANGLVQSMTLYRPRPTSHPLEYLELQWVAS